VKLFFGEWRKKGVERYKQQYDVPIGAFTIGSKSAS